MIESNEQTTEFQHAERIQRNLIATLEKKCLIWIAERLPGWIHSDHLTILGVAGMLLAGVSYALATVNPYAPLVATVWLAVNWFGDSLDGTLARVRNRQRPRYGFYVDHILDTFGMLFLMAGIAASDLMNPWIAIGFLVIYYMLSIDIYLATYARGTFRMSFWGFGPTELRLLLAAGNFVVMYKPVVHILGSSFRLFDVGGFVGMAAMGMILLISATRNTIALYRLERLPQ